MTSTETRVEPRAERTRRTRTAILDAAARGFSSAGYASISMDQIATGAGVTKPTVYAHFGSKEDLFTALLGAALTELDEMPLPVVEQREQVGAALAAYALQRIDSMLAEPTLGVFRAATTEAIRRPEWAQALMNSLGTSEFERWIESATEQGFLVVDSSGDAAELFWGQLEGLLFFPVVIGVVALPDRATRRRIVDQATEMFLARYAPA